MKTTTLLTTTLIAALLFAAATTHAQPVSNTMPVITLGVPDANANESGDPGRFVLHRAGPTNDPVNVFLLIGGTASNGVDYAAIPNWQTIPAGVRERGINVEPLVDTLAEGPETVGLKLVPSPLGIPATYIIGLPDAGVVTISENTSNPPPPNVPVVTVRTVDGEAVEPAPGLPPNPGAFRIFRDGPTNNALNVLFRLGGVASNGVDYEFVADSVLIPAGVRGVDVVIRPRGDILIEGVEPVNIRLADVVFPAIFPPVPGTYVVGTPREAMLGILDRSQTNHPPLARILKPFDGQMFLPGANIPIVVDTVDLDGYCRRVEFFADGNSIGVREKHFITPPPPGEHIGFELVWSNAPSGRHVLSARATDEDGASAWAAPVCVWVASTNSEPCVTIHAADPIAAEGTNYVVWTGGTNENAVTNMRPINTALFVVRRSGPTNNALTVHYHIGGTASNGVDYLELPGMVTIPAGRRAAELRVVPVDDAAPEPIETIRLGLRLPPTATVVPGPYCVGWPGRAGAVIVDNDGPRPPTGHLPDRTFHVAMGGDHGQWFRIECSDDGVRWRVVCVTQVVDGGIYFLDAEADELPSRFYRCVPTAPPPPE